MADPVFFVAFLARLVMEKSLLQTGEFILATRNIVRDLLERPIGKTYFFSVSNGIHPSSALAYSFIEACVKGSHIDLAEAVIDKLVNGQLSRRIRPRY
ncbi:hypothetical protein B0H17DRAFT_272154 [Mycena rosella]|uniref:Uncharacterized protein n=1 Tax=Mycena rosella TaxID=1033263 RepID=A0AAD7DVJ2_MYCRO|nr:hypothetical protein B0H17DRAFT_272154 [Mycena rosella]